MGIRRLSEFWVLDMRALSAPMFGLRCPVPRGHVLGYIRAQVLVIVPLLYVFVAGPNKHDVFTRVSDLAEILTPFKSWFGFPGSFN